MPKRYSFLKSLSVASLALLSSSGFASIDEAFNPEFKLSGFMSTIGGKILNHDTPGQWPFNNNLETPMYIADWSNAGVYHTTFSLDPESRVGVQADWIATPKLSFTFQSIIRGTSLGPKISWAYGTYQLNNQWAIQFGRKRIPIYFYSDFQDIGFSYPWIAVPPELYGWQATNYNGVNASYTNTFGNINVYANALTGMEKIDYSLYQKVFDDEKTSALWNKLFGAEVVLSQGPITTRLVYIQSDTGSLTSIDIYGFAFNVDFNQWFLLSEITNLITSVETDGTLDGYRYFAPAAVLTLGARLESWTPSVTYGIYWEKTNNETLYIQPVKWQRYSGTLRYDLSANSCLKAQLDRNIDFGYSTDTSKSAFNTGKHTILRFGYDFVF